MYLNKPVAYLTDEDIDASGTLVNSKIPQDKPVFLMIQANFCGHCTKAKPDFQKLANDMQNKVFFATIQGDGKEKGEPVKNDKFKVITGGKFMGFPTYAGRNSSGKWVEYEGGRDYASMKKFIESL